MILTNSLAFCEIPAKYFSLFSILKFREIRSKKILELAKNLKISEIKKDIF